MIKRNFHLRFLAAVLLGPLPAMAQPEPPPPPLGFGFSHERQLHLKANDGPFQVVTDKFTLPPGGVIDWHDHPGTGVITVLEGTFEEFKENGCVVRHSALARSVFFETQGEVHKVVNPSLADVAVGLITFFLPLGSNPITPVGPPPERPCAPGQSKQSPEAGTESLD